MTQYRTAIIACGTIARVHARGWLGVPGQPTQIAAIAERLSLSPKTVRNHVSNIFSKLQVADRAQAILRAREAGW